MINPCLGCFIVPCRTSKQKKVVILTFDTNFRTHRNLILLACPVLWNWSNIITSDFSISDIFQYMVTSSPRLTMSYWSSLSLSFSQCLSRSMHWWTNLLLFSQIYSSKFIIIIMCQVCFRHRRSWPSNPLCHQFS